jgi:hypothetical protein
VADEPQRARPVDDKWDLPARLGVVLHPNITNIDRSLGFFPNWKPELSSDGNHVIDTALQSATTWHKPTPSRRPGVLGFGIWRCSGIVALLIEASAREIRDRLFANKGPGQIWQVAIADEDLARRAREVPL